MSAEPIIRVEGLGKRYLLGAQRGDGGKYRTLRDTLADAAASAVRRLGARRKPAVDPQEFWALRDVSFEVKPGEVVGIIGRNGAGKSTLLKVLSRITEPTHGRISIAGRVASLLEVGTGFHPELTGRENVFLNGAILGMHRSEIKAKFDEIVAFAEVEKFLDTPVKRYSSGMYVRLAFAVAAHLEPEILIVDEVLAVGDLAFQKKCMGKMSQIGDSGRTVLFVSHSMPAINRLCDRAILLNEGALLLDGSTEKVMARYLTSGEGLSSARRWAGSDPHAPGNDAVRLRAVEVCTRNARGEAEALSESTMLVTEEIGIRIEFEVLRSGAKMVPNFHFFNSEGVCLFVSHDWETGWHRRPRSVGTHVATAWAPRNFFNEGSVIVGVALSNYDPFEVYFYERDAVSFQVSEDTERPTARGDYTGHLPGVIRPILTWSNATPEQVSA